MKLGRFATVEAPMTDRLPASDAEIARKLCKIQERFYDADTEWRRDACKREMRELLDQHSAHQRAFENWFNEGKPDLETRAV